MKFWRSARRVELDTANRAFEESLEQLKAVTESSARNAPSAADRGALLLVANERRLNVMRLRIHYWGAAHWLDKGKHDRQFGMGLGVLSGLVISVVMTLTYMRWSLTGEFAGRIWPSDEDLYLIVFDAGRISTWAEDATQRAVAAAVALAVAASVLSLIMEYIRDRPSVWDCDLAHERQGAGLSRALAWELRSEGWRCLVDSRSGPSWHPAEHVLPAGRRQRRLSRLEARRGFVFGFGAATAVVFLMVVYAAFFAMLLFRLFLGDAGLEEMFDEIERDIGIAGGGNFILPDAVAAFSRARLPFLASSIGVVVTVGAAALAWARRHKAIATGRVRIDDLDVPFDVLRISPTEGGWYALIQQRVRNRLSLFDLRISAGSALRIWVPISDVVAIEDCEGDASGGTA